MPSAATKPGHWAASPSLTQTFNKILDNFSRVFTFTSTCVFLDEIGFLRVIAQRNHPYRDDLIGMRFPYAGNLLVKQLIQTGQPLRLADAQQDPRFEKWADAAHVRGWMALPLVVAGRVIGLICVDSEQVNAYSEQDLHLAQAFADQAAVAVERPN